MSEGFMPAIIGGGVQGFAWTLAQFAPYYGYCTSAFNTEYVNAGTYTSFAQASVPTSATIKAVCAMAIFKSSDEAYENAFCLTELDKEYAAGVCTMKLVREGDSVRLYGKISQGYAVYKGPMMIMVKV